MRPNMYGVCDHWACNDGPTATVRGDDQEVWFLCTSHAILHMAEHKDDTRSELSEVTAALFRS